MATIIKTFFFPVTPAQACVTHHDPARWHRWIDGAQGPGKVIGDG